MSLSFQESGHCATSHQGYFWKYLSNFSTTLLSNWQDPWSHVQRRVQTKLGIISLIWSPNAFWYLSTMKSVIIIKSTMSKTQPVPSVLEAFLLPSEHIPFPEIQEACCEVNKRNAGGSFGISCLTARKSSMFLGKWWRSWMNWKKGVLKYILLQGLTRRRLMIQFP